MECYRIAQAQYANDLSGTGAKLFGGRWNSEGWSAIYTAGHRSLALLEVLVHLDINSLQERIYNLTVITLPTNLESEMTKIELEQLPMGWMNTESLKYTQNLGDAFLQINQSLVLRVPSALIPEEYNYIINPRHELIREVTILQARRIDLDQRLIKTT